MPRPRIEGFEEKIIQGFIERGIFKNQKEVISAALRLLAEHQMELESINQVLTYTDQTYSAQLNQQTHEEEENAAVGNLAR